jgi:selenocysteine lyase/cysteine desulfurase
MDAISAHDAELQRYGRERLQEVPDLHLYSTWSFDHPHIGVMNFNLRDLHHSLVASILSSEYGIGVRDGCFCAHPLMLHTLCVDPEAADVIREDISQGYRIRVPGSVRASFGLDSTNDDVDRLAEALTEISASGPRWTYVADEAGGSYHPDPDSRPWPALAPGLRLAR